jgi:hypothetical protein
MLIKIKCPDCGVEGAFSLLDATYQGPYKCWKCRKLYKLVLSNGQLIECNSISEEEFQYLQDLHKLSKKFKKDED